MFEKSLKLIKKDVFKVFGDINLSIIYYPDKKDPYPIKAIFRGKGVDFDQFGNPIIEYNPYIHVSLESFKSPPKTGEKIKIDNHIYRIKNIIEIGYNTLNLELSSYDSPS